MNNMNVSAEIDDEGLEELMQLVKSYYTGFFESGS